MYLLYKHYYHNINRTVWDTIGGAWQRLPTSQRGHTRLVRDALFESHPKLMKTVTAKSYFMDT